MRLTASSPTYLEHNWNLTKLSSELDRVAAIETVLEGGRQLASVCDMAFSALRRENFAVFGLLVGGGDLRALKVHILEPDANAVLPLRPSPLVAVEVDLCADVCQTVRQQSGLAIVAKKAVERLDVRVDGSLESRVCRMILGRISEQVLTTESVVFVIPLRACGRRRHLAEEARPGFAL